MVVFGEGKKKAFPHSERQQLLDFYAFKYFTASLDNN
jgi:hypothetical protein